jgi:hypothetical protein
MPCSDAGEECRKRRQSNQNVSACPYSTAIRTYYVRAGLIAGPESAVAEAENLPQVQVLALDGSYHGGGLHSCCLLRAIDPSSA